MSTHQIIAHSALQNRLEVSGLLELETALHVGSGQASATTDAGVIRDSRGMPLVPGSSLKGALRNAVERRVDWLNLQACLLEPGYQFCLSTNRIPDSTLPRDSDSPLPGRSWREQPLWWRLQQMENGGLCDVCKTFGSTVFGGKVQVDDLPLAKEFEIMGSELFEKRDGVAIDRDSGTAVDTLKFDYQVVPSLTAFRFYLTAENLNLDRPGMALLSLGLLEMMNGAVPIGGKSTRGLGRCRLRIDKLYHFNFTANADRLGAAENILRYLQPRGEYSRELDPVAFLQGQVQSFWESQNHAQASGQ